jgi:hypothetical protein
MLVHDPSSAEGVLAFFGQALAGFPLDVSNEGLRLPLAFRGGELGPGSASRCQILSDNLTEQSDPI